MASIIPGYNYDIFISYRQKDNKHDGWVTEFVNNLEGELESTFKEDISVYFDINPDDGLLETHDVDESLKEKLRCLIFIPIISRTYCDPKSFAWENEFKAFVEQASKDQFGLKVKLPNGNVANRVLPVLIHELDNEDISLCESVIGSVLRGIEFIYKSAGVNRPLLLKEENPQDNLNHTNYRDQINKAANAIKDIISAIKYYCPQKEEVVKEEAKPISKPKNNYKTSFITVSVIALALIILGILFIPKLFKPEEELEKSIAVLPFKYLSDEPDKQYIAEGMMDAITLHLSKINDLRVLGRTSTEQYRNPAKTLTDIGKDLDVSYLLEGSFQKFGDSVRLIVQLIKTGKEGHVWANNYDRLWKNVFSLQSEVAQKIASELYVSLTPEEKELIEKVPTTDSTAYDLYLKANDYRLDYSKVRNLGSYNTAVNLYNTALELDPYFAHPYIGLANIYWDRYFWQEYYEENFLDSCLSLVNLALSIDKKLDEAYFIKGEYYRQNGDIYVALDNYDKAIEINPNFLAVYQARGVIYTGVLRDMVKALENYYKALSLVSVSERPSLLRNIGGIYANLGFFEMAKDYYQEALEITNDQFSYLGNLAGIEFSHENYEEALRLQKKRLEIDSTFLFNLHFILYAPGHIDEAYGHALKLIEQFKRSGTLMNYFSHRIGYTFYQVGKFKEADDYFRQQIRYSEESIKLNRGYAQNKSAHYDLSATYAFLGDKSKAYKHLDEFNTMDYIGFNYISFVEGDPMYESIRTEERFRKIVQDMKDKNKAEYDRVRKWLEEQQML